MNTRQYNNFSTYIGTCCKKHRQKLGYTQLEVSFELGTTRENVAKFESGQNRNYMILLWYVLHNMNIIEVVTAYANESKRDFTTE